MKEYLDLKEKIVGVLHSLVGADLRTDGPKQIWAILCNRAAHEILKQLPDVPEWVSPEERMPTEEECGDIVLACVNGSVGGRHFENATVLCWTPTDGEWFEYGTGLDLTGLVDRWTEVPIYEVVQDE